MVTQGTLSPAIAPQPEFADILKEDMRYSSGDAAATGESLNGGFDRLMLQSGIRTSPAVWLMLCVLAGVTLSGTVFVIMEVIPLAVLTGLIGLVAPVLIAMAMRSRRQKDILTQLPEVADELARSARSGKNIENALQFVAGDTAAPLGDELRLVVRRMDMGIDVASAVRDLSERTGVSAITMLSSALSLHQDSGGDLVLVLERLASAVRDRMHFANRMRAATIASRLGATMMLIIPPLIVGFYVFREPDYLDSLLSSFWGKLAFYGGITLQIVGAFLVFRILRRTARF